MGELPEYIDGLPDICGSEQRIDETIRATRGPREPRTVPRPGPGTGGGVPSRRLPGAEGAICLDWGHDDPPGP